MSKPQNQALQAALARAQKAQSGIRAAEERHVPVEYLRLDQLEPSPFQARKDFQHLAELAADIKRNGVLQPVLVRPLGEDRYQLIAGERRWRASKMSQQETIPAVIREMTDQEARSHGLRENLQREDLNAYELARAIVDLMAVNMGCRREDVQADLGRATPSADTLKELNEVLRLVNKNLTYQSFRRNYLSLLRLPAAMVAAIEQGASYSAVLALRAATPEQQAQWLPKIVAGDWSRREVQLAIQKAKKPHEFAPVEEWEAQMQKLQQEFTAERLATLNKRKQQKAQQLLLELNQLFDK